jgi:hypothetical protein
MSARGPGARLQQEFIILRSHAKILYVHIIEVQCHEPQ